MADLWHVLLERQPLRRTDVMLPDASRLHVADDGMQRVWHSVIGTPGNRARVLASADDATLEAASRALSISDRTGRRRIAEAVDHSGVNNMLALGAAWGARQRV